MIIFYNWRGNEKVSISVQSEREGFLYIIAVSRDGKILNLVPEGMEKNRLNSFQEYSLTVLKGKIAKYERIAAILVEKELSFINQLRDVEGEEGKKILSTVNKNLTALELNVWMTAESDVMQSAY